MTKTAISFRIPEKLWNAFKTQADELFLSRAPFLNYMVKRELTYLREDLAGLKLSTRAKRHISGQLKRNDAKSVNIEVDSETAEALRATVAEHNLVRDAFMCRLIILLRSTDALLKYLEVPRHATSTGFGIGLEEMPSSPLRAMEAVRDDPLYYVRSHVQHGWQCGLYRVQLQRSVDWAACYLEDELILGTRAHKKKQKEDNEMFAFLDIPASPPPSKVRTVTRSPK